MKATDYDEVPINLQLAEALEGIMQDWNDATIATVYRGKPGCFDVAVQRLANARSVLAAASRCGAPTPES